MTIDEFLALLDNAKKSEEGWSAKCPAHDDRHASLSVAVGREGQILVRCHAGDGCSLEQITSKLGLTVSDLFADSNGNSREIVATYDYEDEAGALLYQVVRFRPKDFRQRRPDGRGGWVWKLGTTRRVLYRLPRLLEAVTAGRTVWICEGEKDVEALEQAGEVATCNPMGATKWRDSYSKVLRGAHVVIVQDRDQEGARHAVKVATSLAGVASSVRVVEAAQGKDAADHLTAGLGIADFVELEDPSEQSEHPSTDGEGAPLGENGSRTDDPRTIREPPALAFEPELLAVFGKELERAGLAGEEQAAKLILLALTSRLLPWGRPTERPVSMLPKGTSSSGKSHLVRTVLRFVPPEAYFDLGSMSKRYLLYSDEPLAHRILVVPEWAVVANDEEIVALLRVLLSEGRISHGTVDTDNGKREARRLEKSGPCGLLMTTTAASTDFELETRCLSFTTDDSPEQTRRVYEVLAQLEDDVSTVDFEPWHELQRWLASKGEQRVRVPYVKALARLMPNTTTRLRRDFTSMLCLIRAHAILHRGTRETDDQGRAVATIADYAAVRELVNDVIAESVEMRVPAAIRETVEKVRVLTRQDGIEYVSVKKLADELGIGRPATYDRVKRALYAGYLVDLAKTDERSKKLTVGGAMPGEDEFLPTAEAVELGWLSDRSSEDEKGSTEPEASTFSDSRISRMDTDTEASETEGWLGQVSDEELDGLAADELEKLAEQGRA